MIPRMRREVNLPAERKGARRARRRNKLASPLMAAAATVAAANFQAHHRRPAPDRTLPKLHGDTAPLAAVAQAASLPPEMVTVVVGAAASPDRSARALTVGITRAVIQRGGRVGAVPRAASAVGAAVLGLVEILEVVEVETQPREETEHSSRKCPGKPSEKMTTVRLKIPWLLRNSP